jgi:pimeloyl-ACP methyl ester carboxylesterase
MSPSRPPQTPTHPLDPANPRVIATGRMLRAVGRIAPRTGARVAEALFVKTARPTPRPPEARYLATARRGHLRVHGQRIATYAWGPADGPLVILTHGWQSHAGRFTPMAKALVAEGYRTVAFDGPGHGASSGWRATMPEFARTIRAVVDAHGPAHAAIGHSLGGAATLFALSHGLPAGRGVTIAAPADVTRWVTRFREVFRLSDRVYRHMQANMERRVKVRWDDLDLSAAAQRVTVPGLVVHDEDDPDVPLADATTLVAAWPGAALHRTTGLGHRAVLRDDAVIARVLAFLGEPAPQNGL